MQEKLVVTIKYIVYWCVLPLLFLACTYDTIDPQLSDCSDGSLAVQVIRSQGSSDCINSTGIIEVLAVGGVPPYRFALGGGATQFNSIFTNLSAGEYTIIVFDAQNCSDTVVHSLPSLENSLTAEAMVIADSGCLTNINTGTIKVKVLNGKPPYQFQLDNQSFSNDSIFHNLKFGNYTVIIKDALQCQFSLDLIVPRNASGVSWQSEVKPIIDFSCAKSGCHDDKSGRTNLMDFKSIKESVNQIRSRVINRSMPFDASLPEAQIQLIVCWIDDGAPDN